MICTKSFEGNANETFGLKVVDGQNLLSCTAAVVDGANERRFTFEELQSGQAFWQLRANTAYMIVMQVQSKVPGQDVSVEVEIPLNSGDTSTCSRLSSGIIGNWRVDVF